MTATAKISNMSLINLIQGCPILLQIPVWLSVTQKHLQHCPPSHWEQWRCSWQHWGWRSSEGSAAVGTLLSWPAWGGYGNHPPAPSAKPGNWAEPVDTAESGTVLREGWWRDLETSFNLIIKYEDEDFFIDTCDDQQKGHEGLCTIWCFKFIHISDVFVLRAPGSLCRQHGVHFFHSH